MTRVLVHAGFHKTGTTSLQRFLAQNRATLAPSFAYFDSNDFSRARSAAQTYAKRPYFWRRLKFRRAFREFINSVPKTPIVVLSCETFSGTIPGHRDFFGRPVTDMTKVATTLAKEITAALKDRFGPTTQIEFLYTLRDPKDWEKSVYGHLLRSIHLKEDFDTFRKQFSSLDPALAARQIAAEIAPIKVHLSQLENYSDNPLGPGAAVLDILDIPANLRDTLVPAKRRNIGQSQALRDAFLALNRSAHPKDGLKTAKDQMIREHRKGKTRGRKE